MGDKVSLNVTAREVHGKKVRQLRAEGLVPGVVYGAGMESLAVQVDAGELRHVIMAAGKHTPVNLVGAKRRIAMIKAIAYDPTKSGVVWHVSFHAVKANEPVRAEVPVRLIGVGESEAEKIGLIILQAIERIEVRALPADLPEAIEIDISGMAEVGDRVTIADAKLPEGVEYVERDDGRREDGDDEEERPTVTDLVVASVYEPAALEAANEAAAGAAEAEEEVEVTEEESAEEAEAGEPDEK